LRLKKQTSTGKHVTKSAGTRKRKDADREAGKWQAELREGRYQKPSKWTWEAFREYYSAHALPGLSPRTAQTYESTLNVFKAKCNPAKLADVTTARVNDFVGKLREAFVSEATIAHHLRHLKASMRWANRQGLLPTLPQFSMPKRAKGAKLMRGRAVTGEEFERMLRAVPRAIGARPNTLGIDIVTPWRFYLRGLWLSGLRLSESLTLRWDDAPGAIVVDYSHRRPMLRIPAEVEKGNQDRLWPMTPDFAALLDSVPEADRRGRVFKLLTADGKALRVSACEVSRVAVAIGKAANVVVDERQRRRKGDDGKTVETTERKFASCHDLRRAFAVRWSAKLMPTQLRELMRHASIATTLGYYIGTNAEATADAIWEASGNTLGNTPAQRKSAGNRRRSNETAKHAK
jgi:integrase